MINDLRWCKHHLHLYELAVTYGETHFTLENGDRVSYAERIEGLRRIIKRLEALCGKDHDPEE